MNEISTKNYPTVKYSSYLCPIFHRHGNLPKIGNQELEKLRVSSLLGKSTCPLRMPYYAHELFWF